MRLAKYTKDPNERKRYTIDYSPWLDVGELLSSVTSGVTPVTTSPLVIDTIAVNGNGFNVSFFVSGGLHGQDYKLTITATTDASQIKEDNILFVVRDE
jgi:hypothetical protein